MDRSNKHGPRIDDEMRSETESLERSGHESRVEEWREAEPAGEDQPTADALLSGDLRPSVDTPAGLSHDEREARSELAQRLGKEVWPARRDALERVATENEAPDWVLAMIRNLPADREYINLQDVWRTLGGTTEDARA